MELVVNALDDLGYGIAWRVLDAQHFGVPQRRRRVFIVGSLGDNGATPAKILALGEGRAGYLESSKSKRQNSARKIEQRAQGYRESSFGQFAATLESGTLKAKSGVAGGGSETLLIP